MKKTAKKILAGILTAAVMLTGSTGIMTAQAAAGDPKPYEWEQLYLTNRERLTNGLQPLSAFSNLTQAAQIRAKEQITRFGHTRPDGRSWDTILNEKGISKFACGENVAVGYSTPQQVTAGWMDSPGHRANILNSGFVHMGVGYAQGNSMYYHHWAQIFTGGCSPDEFWVYDGDDGEACESYTVFQVEKGTVIEDMNLIGALSCPHGTAVFPLDAALCSGYNPTKADNIAHTVTVKAYGMQTKFKIMVTTPLNGEPAPTLNRKAVGRNAVELSWTKVNGAEKYRIYRREGKSGAFTHIGTVTGTAFTDKKAAAGVDLCYRVRAVRGTETGKYSSIRSIKLAPAAPKLLSAVPASNRITAAWNPVKGADGYELWCKKGNGSYQRVRNITGGAAGSTNHFNAEKGKTYTYKVRAFWNVNGKRVSGAFSGTKTVTFRS